MYNASNTLITEGDVAVCIGGVFVCVWGIQLRQNIYCTDILSLFYRKSTYKYWQCCSNCVSFLAYALFTSVYVCECGTCAIIYLL